MTRDISRNPFAPGFGRPPPFMGRRPEVEHELDDIIRGLGRSESPEPRALYLYGPRGTGKTVHIRDFKTRLRQGLDAVTIISLSARMVKTEKAMEQVLFTPDIELAGGGLTDGEPVTRSEAFLDRIKGWVKKIRSSDSGLMQHVQTMRPKDLRIWGGLGHIRLEPPDEPDISSGRSLQRLEAPLLITLDEAHKVEPAALGHLLDAVQEAGETQPTVLMLGGTPDLIDQLRVCESTFWDRGKRLHLGRLSKASATDVLEVPLRQAGITVDGPTLDDLVKATDHYPWFLQLYGHEAYKAVQETGGRHLGPVIGSEVRKRARLLREMNYDDRRQEFRTPEQTRAALAVAQAFRDNDGIMEAPQLESLLAAFDTDEPGQTERHMRHVGLIVEGVEPGTREPGVPSFMDYLLRVLEPDLPTPSPAEPEATNAASKDDFKP